jgi:hypothetical protein
VQQKRPHYQDAAFWHRTSDFADFSARRLNLSRGEPAATVRPEDSAAGPIGRRAAIKVQAGRNNGFKHRDGA